MKRLIPLLIAIAAIVSSAYAQGYDRILNIYKDGVLKHKYNVTGLDYIDFEKKPKLKVTAVVSPENSGTVTINGLSSPQYISEDSTATFIASPKDGYVFSNWVINGKEIPYTTTITRDTECVANFVSVASSDLGVSLQGNAFAIPNNEIGFGKESSFTISFRVYINQFNHDTYGTQLLNIRSALDTWPQSDWGYMWSQINTDGTFNCVARSPSIGNEISLPISQDLILHPKTWYRLIFCKEYNSDDGSTSFYLYLNGELISSKTRVFPIQWRSSNVIMIGGTAFGRAGLDGIIDDVRLYDLVLTETLIDFDHYPTTHLIGYWDFNTPSEGYDTLYSKGYNNNIQAKMYNIDVITAGNQNFISVPFYFTAEGH